MAMTIVETRRIAAGVDTHLDLHVAAVVDEVGGVIRVLMVPRRSAIDERIATLNQLRHVVLTAEEPVRARFRGLSAVTLAKRAAALRPRQGDIVRHATLLTIRLLGRRVLYLREETKELGAVLRPLIAET